MEKTYFSKKDLIFKTLVLGIPIAMQNLISVLVNMLDTIMIGQIGEAELAAINQVNSLYLFFNMFVWGVSIGTVVITSRYYGMGKIDPMRTLTGYAMKINIIAACILSLVVLTCPYAVMRLFASDPDVIEYGTEYLKILGWFYILPAVSNTYLTNLRAVHNVKVSVYIYTGSCFTNLFLNWVFIYGNFGAPELGVQGAAIATAISKIIEFVIVTVYMYKVEKTLNFRLKYMFSDIAPYRKKFFKTCFPVFISEFVWGLGMTVQAANLGHYSKEFLAAYSLTMVIMDLSTVAMCGFANASLIILANDIGAGKDQEAMEKSRLLVWGGVVVAVVMVLILMIIRPFAPGFIVCSETTKKYILATVLICAYVDMCYGISWNVSAGVLRAGGDTKFIAFVDCGVTIAMKCIMAPVISMYSEVSPILIMFISCSDDFIKVFFFLTRYLKGNWIRHGLTVSSGEV